MEEKRKPEYNEYVMMFVSPSYCGYFLSSLGDPLRLSLVLPLVNRAQANSIILTMICPIPLNLKILPSPSGLKLKVSKASSIIFGIDFT